MFFFRIYPQKLTFCSSGISFWYAIKQSLPRLRTGKIRLRCVHYRRPRKTGNLTGCNLREVGRWKNEEIKSNQISNQQLRRHHGQGSIHPGGGISEHRCGWEEAIFNNSSKLCSALLRVCYTSRSGIVVTVKPMFGRAETRNIGSFKNKEVLFCLSKALHPIHD